MKKSFLCFLAFFSFAVSAFDEFLITDIRIVGLQRVSIGSIFTAIPVSVGDKMNEGKVSEITRALFSTAQFNDIQIGKDGNALIKCCRATIDIFNRIRGKQSFKI